MANIYVRRSGNDSNDGSTPALAKLTIASAITAASSGDSIYIGAGIYREPESDISSKNLYFYGDPTGENTGDAGEVIWTGMNSTDTDYNNYTDGGRALLQSVGGSTTIGITVKNITFQKFRNGAIRHVGPGRFDIQDCNFFDIKGTAFSFLSAYDLRTVITLKNIYVDGVASSEGVYIFDGSNQGVYDIDNIKIRNVFYGSGSSSSTVYGLYFDRYDYGNDNYYNIDVSNVFAFGHEGMTAVGIYNKNKQYGTQYFNNCRVDNIISTATNGVAYGVRGETYTPIRMRNSSVGLVYGTTSEKYAKKDETYPWAVKTDSLDLSSYDIFKIPQISKFSKIRGKGGSTKYESEDIEGNPRPAYGNGTACDIGASEATSDIIQKESTIKDSGDYSMKVTPCNYFKKTFQIPVTASELRTVKAKIRIDGTWGTYLPRISLSGQGMTLSQATKNSTTGSFEELTVSGTPTSTGIALLTIEAHSASTDAAFYIDTITIE